MNHYNLAKTLDFLQKSLPETLLPFDLPQIADLCNCGELTPIVYYSRFLDTIIACEYDHPQFINAYEFKGYLTDIQLNELVYECSNAKDESINQLSKLLYNADIHEIMEVHYPVDNDKKLHIGDRVALFYYKQRYDEDYQKNTSDQKESDALMVTPSMIRFAANNVKDYIASKQTAEQNTPEQQLIAELEREIADIKKQLEQARAKLANKPADDLKDIPHQTYKTLDKVMYAMAKITNLDNSKPYSQNTPSLNAAITTILQNAGLPLEYEAVGKWLSRINDIKPLK